MKHILKPAIATAVLHTALNAVVPCQAAEQTNPTSVHRTAPTLVAQSKPLSREQLAHYRNEAAQVSTATKHQAAGASSSAGWWILGGVVVVVGVVALSHGGGGGGMGGGY